MCEAGTGSTAEPALFIVRLRLRPEGVAEPGPRLEHRMFILGNDIVAYRISCKPQKVQAMSSGVKIGRGGWRTARAGWPEDVVAMPRSSRGRRGSAGNMGTGNGWDGCGSAAVFRLGAEDEQDQAVWSARAGRDCCLG